MTYLPATDLKLSNGTTYEDWLAAVGRIVLDRTGHPLDDFENQDLFSEYESGSSARDASIWFLRSMGMEFEDLILADRDTPLTGRERALGVG